MFGQCAKCGLTVPNTLLIPVIAKTNQGTKQVFVCMTCEKIIKEQQNQQPSARSNPTSVEMGG